MNSNRRLLAIGDIHGDIDALARILLGLEVIDDEGNWSAHDTDLVLLGDLNDRGADSVAVMELVMALEQQAPAMRSRVVALVGNHEILVAQRDFRYVTAREVLALERCWFENRNGLDAIFRGRGPYAAWMRSRPTILMIGRTAFVHAGVDRRLLDLDAVSVNQTVTRWMAHLQGVEDDSPADGMAWLIDEDERGPLWTHRFGVAQAGSVTPEEVSTVRQVLSHLGVDRVVVGHMPTSKIDYVIAYPHAAYGEQVVAIDTGISKAYGGRLSAVDLSADGVRPIYFDRGTEETSVARIARAACQARLQTWA